MWLATSSESKHWKRPNSGYVPRIVGHLGRAVGHVLILGFHGLGRRRAHYNYERATARRGRLPESLGCTTDYRHETGARRTPPRSGRRRRRPRPAPRAAAASIHSLRTQLFIRPARTRKAARSAPPRERAARARAPLPPPPARRHSPTPARARPPAHAPSAHPPITLLQLIS